MFYKWPSLKVSMVIIVRKSEVVHKQVGGYLISYNLELACVKGSCGLSDFMGPLFFFHFFWRLGGQKGLRNVCFARKTLVPGVYCTLHWKEDKKTACLSKKKLMSTQKKRGDMRGARGGFFLLSQYVTGFNLQLGNCLKITFAGSRDDTQYGNVFRGWSRPRRESFELPSTSSALPWNAFSGLPWECLKPNLNIPCSSRHFLE